MWFFLFRLNFRIGIEFDRNAYGIEHISIQVELKSVESSILLCFFFGIWICHITAAGHQFYHFKNVIASTTKKKKSVKVPKHKKKKIKQKMKRLIRCHSHFHGDYILVMRNETKREEKKKT